MWTFILDRSSFDCHNAIMPKRSRNDDPEGANQLAKSIVDQVTSSPDDDAPAPPAKNPAAVALGRLGGLKGGKARAKKLSKARRREIAIKAATTRWAGHKKKKKTRS